MIGNYEKVIVLKTEKEEVVGIVIFDEKSHTPTFYLLNKCGMDDIIELYKDNSKINTLIKNGIDTDEDEN